jgi:hypothetical protein
MVLASWCASHDVPLHVFDWRSEHEAAGLARDAIYLLRPDTCVPLADRSSTETTPTLHRRGLEGLQWSNSSLRSAAR